MKKLYLALAFAACSYHAQAHSPFVAPSNYVVSGDNTSILAGFAEHPFDSEVAIQGFEFHVIQPKGESKKLELVNTSSLTTANVESKVDGTYQIVGQRSAKIQYAKVGQRWLRVLDAKGANVPPLDVRNFVLPTELTTKHEKFDVQRVDTLLSYFTKYQTSTIQPNPSQTGLALSYSKHPNSLKVGDQLKLTVQLNQKAAAGYQVQVEQQNTSVGEKTQVMKYTTNQQGQTDLSFKQSGQYVITISSPEHQENKKPEANTYRTMLSVFVSP